MSAPGIFARRDLPAWLKPTTLDENEIAIWWGTVDRVEEYCFERRPGVSEDRMRFLWRRDYMREVQSGRGSMFDRAVYDLPPDVLIAAGYEAKRLRGGR